MDIENRRALKEEARRSLAAASYDPKRLALIHTGISVAVALLITFLDYYLNHWIAGTASGLSGMGSRRILETMQVTLQSVQGLAMPFWEIGFIFVALQLLRQQPTQPKNLLEGFRRFSQVLRLRLMEGFLYFGAAFMCMYAASFLFRLTPFSRPMMDFLTPLMDQATTVEQLYEAMMNLPAEALLAMSAPFMVMFAVLFLVVFLRMHYKYRLAAHLVMDHPGMGAIQALIYSSRMTRKKRWALLKLDLSFWWFYLLMGFSAVVCYMNLLLPMLGISLPMTGDAAWLVFYVLSLLVQLALFWQGKAYVQTTWAAAYETLCRQMEEQMAAQTQPEANLPWEPYETK